MLALPCLLLLALTTTACGDKVQVPFLTKPMIVENKPAEVDLLCPEAVTPPVNMADDLDAAMFQAEDRKAGAECRRKLKVQHDAYYPPKPHAGS